MCKLFLLSNNWTGCIIMSIKRSCVQVNVMCTSNSKCQPRMTYCNCILNNIMIDTFIYFLLSTTYSMPIQHMNSWDMWEVVLPLECVILCCCTLLSFYPDPPFSLNHCWLRNLAYIMVVSIKLGRNAPCMVFIQFGNSIWH